LAQGVINSFQIPQKINEALQLNPKYGEHPESRRDKTNSHAIFSTKEKT